MEVLIENKKKELIEWVNSAKNEWVIYFILDKVHKLSPNYYSKYFRTEYAKGYTSEETRRKSNQKLRSNKFWISNQ